MKWSIELGEFDITYKGRTTIKSQALANFLVEIKYSIKSQDENHLSNLQITYTIFKYVEKLTCWILKVDGANNSGRKGLGILLRSPEGK